MGNHACYGAFDVHHRQAAHARLDHQVSRICQRRVRTCRNWGSRHNIAGCCTYHRGKITVLERPKLEQLTCECYAVVKKETDRLLPLPPPRRRAKTEMSTAARLGYSFRE